MRAPTKCLAAAGCLLAAAAGVAQQPEPDELSRLLAEYSRSIEAWQATAEDSDEGLDFARHPAGEFLPKVRAIAEAHAGEPAALRALEWILEEGGMAPPDVAKANVLWAVQRLTRDHAGAAEMAEALRKTRYLSYQIDSAPLLALYDRVIAENKEPAAVAAATFLKGVVLYRDAETAAAEDAKSPQADLKTPLALFKKVVADFGETPSAKSARGYVFEIENLQVGMRVPEIVGTDVESREIKLSQFRGQVVVLDFWGFW